jgi:hypothetical protein
MRKNAVARMKLLISLMLPFRGNVNKLASNNVQRTYEYIQTRQYNFNVIYLRISHGFDRVHKQNPFCCCGFFHLSCETQRDYSSD